MSARGSTGTGRPARLPAGPYRPSPAGHGASGGLVVEFAGEDGRRKSYALNRLPLPGWHTALADAWHTRVGPGGTLRTLSSAEASWATLGRLLRFLDSASPPPADPSQLTAAHVEAFCRQREAAVGGTYACREVHQLSLLFRGGALRDATPRAALDYLGRRLSKSDPPPKPGYSDTELRQIVAAARADVAQARDRIRSAGSLLERYKRDPFALTGRERGQAEVLAGMAGSGAVPLPPGSATRKLVRRQKLAEQLFMTRRELVPMLVLLAVTTGRNIETLKELPAEHRIIEHRAVEVVITKRRRGPRHWYQSVTWEIGAPGRELHTPGGVYLLLHRLMNRSRCLLEDPAAFWAIWHNTDWTRAAKASPHYNPFGAALNPNIYFGRWVARHGLTVGQPSPATRPEADAGGQPAAARLQLALDFNRLKTSVDVRRTRQAGGHMPSAARSNTTSVLFRNYLRGDPSTIDWAQQVVSEAFSDVEQAAWAAHHRALGAAGGTALRVVAGEVTAGGLADTGLNAQTAQHGAQGTLDTAWSACINHDQHPATGQPCRASFLDCFHCGNCLITQGHLPRLLGLLDALAMRRQQLSEDDWWARYGPVWAAIRFDVLPKFSPAEIRQASAGKPADALLDLVEPGWEHP